MKRITPFLLALLLTTNAFAASDSEGGGQENFQIYRWNQGYRASSEPVLSKKMNEQEFKNFLATKKLGDDSFHKDNLFSGCYLATYERASTRVPASETPKKEFHKICY